MKKITLVLLIGLLMLPVISRAARRKIYPMMMGPKLSTTLISNGVEGDIFGEFLEPLTVSAEMLINLYKNYFWLRTDVLGLAIHSNSNSFGINLGSPFDFVVMGQINEWRPYGFGGIGVSVYSSQEDLSSWVGLDAGGGVSYELSKGLHVFGELGGMLGNRIQSTPDVSTNTWSYGLFLAAGARFAFLW